MYVATVGASATGIAHISHQCQLCVIILEYPIINREFLWDISKLKKNDFHRFAPP